MREKINVDDFVDKVKIALGVSAEAKVYIGKDVVSCVKHVTVDTRAYYVPYLFNM